MYPSNSAVIDNPQIQLKDQSARNSNGDMGITNMNFVRSIWQQMLSVVHCIHEENIIHGDLKVRVY